MKKLTSRSVTDSQIRALRTEAMRAGDIEQARLCDRALFRRGGRGECADAINAARAAA